MTSAMTPNIIFGLQMVGAMIGMVSFVCRCAAMGQTLPGTPWTEYVRVHRLPNLEHYNDRGRQLLFWHMWLAVISVGMVGIAIYFEGPDAS
jgi:hypothetical protein